MSRSDTALTALMRDAVAFSVTHVEAGGLPFVGVVVDVQGYVSDYGVNQVRETGDPTAHAEIVAMRAALRQLGVAHLKGASLLATGEPCGLCYRFAIEHRIERIHVAADSDIVAEFGFDYRASYRSFGIDRARLADIVRPLPVTNRLEPFERYLRVNRLRRHLPSRIRKENTPCTGGTSQSR